MRCAWLQMDQRPSLCCRRPPHRDGVALSQVFLGHFHGHSFYLLIPISVLRLVFGIIGGVLWALQSGQFDNIERQRRAHSFGVIDLSQGDGGGATTLHLVTFMRSSVCP
ncbi:MAG: cbb3-type cytochrome oxidase assembly protein CcoS [Burkholderiaceae bacterium]